MKVRVITRGPLFYSQYYNEDKSKLCETYRHDGASIQNQFTTVEQAIEECNLFAKNNKLPEVVWEGIVI